MNWSSPAVQGSLLWVLAECAGGDPEQRLAGIGRRVQGWEGFLRRFVPYCRPTLAELARQRLLEAGFAPVLACEDPANVGFDESSLVSVPVERPKWVGRRRLSADRCLEDIRRAAAEMGEPLTRRKFDAWARQRSSGDHRVADSVITDRYGTWAQACAAAGVRCGPDPLTKEGMAAALREAALQHQGGLTSAAYKEMSEHDPDWRSCSSVVTAFGTWAAACEAAGVLPSEKPTDDHMLEALRSAAQGAPTVSAAAYEAWRAECPEKRGIPEWAIKHRFGTWAAALKAAGLASAGGNDERELPEEMLLDGLRSAAAHVEGPLSQNRHEQVRRSGVAGPLPSLWTSIKRFGSWSEAKRRAGIR